VRVKYACKTCQEGVVIAGLPARPIEKGRPGGGLLAQVLTSKYCDHTPLHRQILLSPKIHTDDIPVPARNGSGKDIHKGFLWTYTHLE
jgi:transposase